MTVRVLINGAFGRMGQLASSVVQELTGFELVAKCGRGDDLAAAINQHQADVVIDFTTATAAYENTEIILNNKARPIIGTSGLNQDQVNHLKIMAEKYNIGGIIAPNFAIGALLLMEFSAMAARFFSKIEIVEMHHQNKKDAPSGTAIRTAEMIAAELTENPSSLEIPIHSLRLPGVLARQQVIFGNAGETLTLDHNAQNYEVYTAGIRLACKRVMAEKELIYGLHHFLNLSSLLENKYE